MTKENFWARGEAHGKRCWQGLPWPTIKPGDENFSEWLEYFYRHLRWLPSQLKCVIIEHRTKKDATKVMTVPAVWPVHFDASFQTEPHWTPPLRKIVSERDRRETIEQLKARLGPTWGIIGMK